LFGIGFRRGDIKERREGEEGNREACWISKTKTPFLSSPFWKKKYIHRSMRFGLKEDKAMFQVSKYVEVSILISLGGILFGYLPASVL
jgi:hypothetical protein